MSRISTGESKRWALSVFRRDKFKCQMPGCTSKSKKLKPHHIKRWADTPSLRCNINNGITLCQQCHLKTIGKEAEFEALFLGIVASKSDDSLAILMARYGPHPEKNKD